MRKSDPYHCNKCGETLTRGGRCALCEPRAPRFDPASVEQRPVLRGELFGRAHLGRLAAPVSTETSEKAA